MTKRISVDFNTMAKDYPNPEPRVWIHPSEFTPDFQPGLHVLLFDEVLEVEAVLERDDARGYWWGRPDWATRVDLPWEPESITEYFRSRGKEHLLDPPEIKAILATSPDQSRDYFSFWGFDTEPVQRFWRLIDDDEVWTILTRVDRPPNEHAKAADRDVTDPPSRKYHELRANENVQALLRELKARREQRR